MSWIGRGIGATVLGAAVGGLVVFAVQMVNSAIFLLPSGTHPHDAVSVRAAMVNLPLTALVVVLLGWVAAGAAGGWVAARLSGALIPALVVGSLLEAAALVAMIEIRHPIWFMVTGLLVLLPAAWIGARSAGAGRTPDAAGAPRN